MKILLATFWSIPHVGGVWPYMLHLKSKLEEYGHEVDLMGPDDKKRVMQVVNEGRTVNMDQLMEPVKQYLTPASCPLTYIHPLIEYMELKRYSFELGAAFLGIEKYDLIHTQDVISSECISRLKREGTAHVATLHGSVAHEVLKQVGDEFPHHPHSELARTYYRQLEHIGATCADLTVTANHWLKNILTGEFNVRDQQVRVMQYGYDISSFLQQAQGDPGIAAAPGKKVIFFAGRLVDLKGVQHLITALSELKNHRDDWVCWIAGTGEMEASLRAQAAGLGLMNDVLFLGERHDIPKIMAKADLYVQPSLIDNQPLSVVEAQISGVPVIVHHAGGLPEMVQHQVTGLIYSNSNTHELCGHLFSLIADDSYRNYMGENARAWAMEHWALDQGVQNLLQVYNEAAGRQGAGASYSKNLMQQTRASLEPAVWAPQEAVFNSVYSSLISLSDPPYPIAVHKGTWDLIRHAVPAGYTIPNPTLYNL
ncbi:glycosyltransferase [Bacillus mangrovi]|uniref:Glycosyltransferase n=1 Tax=Metabacillus mangrovi TaxID=1491830 RepID=A0A7X2V603_9BACI|nr:glycosyltransferase family 4 protein [Metabacillus mangrovi]MTH55362.1 glycosyltransferase [Metabacillus mangrovi]